RGAPPTTPAEVLAATPAPPPLRPQPAIIIATPIEIETAPIDVRPARFIRAPRFRAGAGQAAGQAQVPVPAGIPCVPSRLTGVQGGRPRPARRPPPSGPMAPRGARARPSACS